MSRWTVFKPDAQRLEEIGFRDVARCYTLFHDRGYAHRQNRYLRDRATGRWVPTFDKGPSSATGKLLREQSNKNNADALRDFLFWCDEAGLDPDMVQYSAIRDYQDDMESGYWSYKGEPLKAGTINIRGDEATFYLMWSADRRMRSRFDVPVVRAKGQPSKMRASAQLLWVRQGRKKEDQTSLRDLVLPTIFSVRAWLVAIEEHRGHAKMLACRTVVETGLRREEVCSLSRRDWPSALDIGEAVRGGRTFVTITLRHTKGGRGRVIQLSTQFATLVRRWLDEQRDALDRAFQARTGKPTPDKLFVSDSQGHEGTPISGPTLYGCFKKKVPDGPKVWFPHFGRHFFACMYILRGITYDAQLRAKTLAEMAPDWVLDRGSFWLRTLQRQLGHLSEGTTEIYLRWLVTSSQFAEIAAGYHSLLDGEVPSHGH
jgi:integrase